MTATTVPATVIRPEGGVDTMTLPRDDEKRLAILQQIVGGYIEAVALPGGRMTISQGSRSSSRRELCNDREKSAPRQQCAHPCGDHLAAAALDGRSLQTTPENIELHLKNIFADGERVEAATTEDFSVVQNEGGRPVRRMLKHYNLDAIIAIGYRVISRRNT